MSVFFLACKGVEAIEVGDGYRRQQKNAFVVSLDGERPSLALGLVGGCPYRYEEERLFDVAAGDHELNAYHDQLAKLGGFNWLIHDVESPGPFRELIGYSSDSGIIGPMVSAKLADDFAWFDERARALGDCGFYTWFTVMRELFEFAAKDGAVRYVKERHLRDTLSRFPHQDGIAALLLRPTAWA
jgi:hypothetical protein